MRVTSLEILYPANPGSIYHMTKTQDQLFFFYYNKNYQLRITDLHQGIVWGTQTSETALDERLINRFDYDGDYGTVLNRFLMQAALGYPLTVHGTGGQTRAFIHIRDTVRCIALAISNPPQRGERVNIFNQMTEAHRLIDLAKIVSDMSGTPYNTDLRKFSDTGVPWVLGRMACPYGAGEAGIQATAQSERISPWLVANWFQAISQAFMMSARLANSELASQWLRRWCQTRSTGLSSGL